MMIRRILIHNSPAFEDIELYMEPGFNVFSGASGSGKSVFMESLLAIFGIKESNADLIEATLDLESISLDWESYGVPLDEDEKEIVLSILKKDKTRYFINHASSSKKRLNEIVSGFAKHISIKGADELGAKNILHIFDRFIMTKDKSHEATLAGFSKDFAALKNARSRLNELLEQESNLAHLKEFAAFEIQKIEAINPKEGEYEELLELKKTLSKQEKIKAQIAKVRHVLEGVGELESFLQLIDEPCASLSEGLSEFEALLEAQEERLGDLEEINPEEMLDKLAKLAELNRRFGSIKGALDYLKEQRAKLKDYEHLSIDKDDEQKRVAALEAACEKSAKALHASRTKHAKDFNAQISALCEQLRLAKSDLQLLQVELCESGISQCVLKVGDSGIEVLSSGEYNRARLVMMCLGASLEKRSGILVLDEIDANLSGEESEGVAKILKTLSQSYQIFAISHQTHMPSLATTHYLVQKEGAKARVVKLDYEGRVREIARMISGAEVSSEALEFARKKLQAGSELS